ncbi:MAG: transposase [Bacteroidia bacterium]|nr:transposase [Bacteroidia bacterium]
MSAFANPGADVGGLPNPKNKLKAKTSDVCQRTMEEGKYYHVFNRSNNKEKLFKEEKNYFYFLSKYVEYNASNVDTLAYCLMPTHFHFLVKVREKESEVEMPEAIPTVSSHGYAYRPLTDIEKGFKNFFTSYAKSINSHYGRHGSLFQSKFKRKPVETTEYLKNLIAYIHFNPIKDGLSKKYEDWKFSSFKTFLNESETMIKREEVLELFSGAEDFLYFHNANFSTDNKLINTIEQEIENFF